MLAEAEFALGGILDVIKEYFIYKGYVLLRGHKVPACR